jgi:hypothetical protein
MDIIIGAGPIPGCMPGEGLVGVGDSVGVLLISPLPPLQPPRNMNTKKRNSDIRHLTPMCKIVPPAVKRVAS